MNHSPASEVSIFVFLPLIVAMGTIALLILVIAPRKGRTRAWALLGLSPLANMVVLIWLASLTDKAVLDVLVELKRRNGLL